MAKVSIIIPSRNEQFMPKTVEDIFAKATGEIEVIVIKDGLCHTPLPNKPNLEVFDFIHPLGMRHAINFAAKEATGKYLLKCDAHCMFAEGFDEALQADCDGDWLVVPRRMKLDAETWTIRDPQHMVDYEYLSYPYEKPDEIGMHGRQWPERARERKDIQIDDDMSFQGSCWFMPRDYFWKLGPMQEEGYGTFMQEPQELGLKVWLGGGRQVRNKKTWYCHLHKGKQYGRGYSLEGQNRKEAQEWCAKYWLADSWPGQVHKFEWLIDKFWPIPTWPEDWRNIEHP